jgi:hypothetical protein
MRLTAPQFGLVDHVVVQQGGGVDELDDRGQLEALRAVETQRLREQQHEAGPDPLAAGADDVARDLVDQRDLGGQAFADQGVDLPQRRVDRVRGSGRGDGGVEHGAVGEAARL